MHTQDLELIVLGMVLAKPELLKGLPKLAGGHLAELAAGRTRKLQMALGDHVTVAQDRTLENILAEWRRRCEHRQRVDDATKELRLAQLGVLP